MVLQLWRNLYTYRNTINRERQLVFHIKINKLWPIFVTLPTPQKSCVLAWLLEYIWHADKTSIKLVIFHTQTLTIVQSLFPLDISSDHNVRLPFCPSGLNWWHHKAQPVETKSTYVLIPVSHIKHIELSSYAQTLFTVFLLLFE